MTRSPIELSWTAKKINSRNFEYKEQELKYNINIKYELNIKIKNSYSGLTNLVELDLSSNLLTAVPTPTFSGGQTNL